MTHSSPSQRRFGFDSAFAIALRSTFSTSRATARGENARMVRASGTVRPRSWSTTSRALRAETCTYFATACTCGAGAPAASAVLMRFEVATATSRPVHDRPARVSSLHLRLRVAGVAAEVARRRELAELVADHLVGDEDRHVLAPVVDRDRVPDHLGEHRRGPRPGADHLLLARLVHGVDPRQQALLHERSLLRAATHRFSFPRRRPRTINLSDSLCLARVRLPSVGTPHGVTGWRPPFDFPSPPPCGWSTGFIAEPRTVGRLPSHRERPALPPVMLPWSTLPTWPTVARQVRRTRRISPDGSRRVACPPSFATSWMPEPAE